MYKFGRKISALLLAAAVTVSAVVPAFAANSPVSGNAAGDTKVTAVTTSDKTVKVTDVSSTGDVAVIPATVTQNGKTYAVDTIATNTIKDKYDKVYLVMNEKTKVEPKVAGTKKSKKTKKIVIKAAEGQMLTASQFDEEAFKGFKGKIVIKKSAMSKKEFKKLKKKLKEGGFKGKITRS